MADRKVVALAGSRVVVKVAVMENDLVVSTVVR